MATRRINFYILREVLTPTLLGLLTFTFILVMGRLPGLTELVINKGVPLGSILRLFSYLLPTFLSITIPLSFLLGILLAFGRLSADSEFVALKASGVSLYALLLPVLLFATICSLATGAMTLYGEPAGKTAFRDQIFTIASERASVGVEAGVFNDSFEGLILYAEALDEQRDLMQRVFISDERSAKEPANIFARSGRFIRNPQTLTLTLRLTQGTIHHLTPGENESYRTIGFSTYDINLNLDQGMADVSKRGKSMGELFPRELLEVSRNAADPRQARRHAVELHKRVSTALAPLVFALIGIPLALQSQRSGKGAGFALALGIALCYYVLLSFASTLAGKGSLPAAVALYLPNLLFLTGGIIFIRRTAQERPIRLPFPSLREIKGLFSRKRRRAV